MSQLDMTGVAPSTPTDRHDAERTVDRIMATVNPVTLPEPLQAIVMAHGIRVEEWDPAALDENLRSKFFAFYVESADGTRILVVPAGQDPTVRLHAVRAIFDHEGMTA
jgi:uncharacterized protein